MTKTLAQRLEEKLVGMADIGPPYYQLYDDPKEAERYSASPKWDHERNAYRFADGSYGRFEQCRDEQGNLLWEPPVGVGLDASRGLPKCTFVAVADAEPSPTE